MSDYKHATDRVKTIVISECPEGCDVGFSIEGEGKTELVDELVAKAKVVYQTCNECGADLGTISKTEPVETLK